MLGLWVFHVLGKRYIGIFLDPVLSCNLRCRMCYFSDEEKRKSLKGSFRYEEMEVIARKLFHRALKLQVGCGAEPTLHKDFVKVIALGKKYQVPYISLTTNGNLLTRELLFEAVESGLDELTLSAHGFTRETYERLMTNADFERFTELLANVAEVKKRYPQFKLRINYTINNDNFVETARPANGMKRTKSLSEKAMIRITSPSRTRNRIGIFGTACIRFTRRSVPIRRKRY